MAQSQPDLLLLSISLSQRLIEIKRVVREVRDAFPELLIGVGGRLLNELPDIAPRLGVDFRGTTPDETVRHALLAVRKRRAAAGDSVKMIDSSVVQLVENNPVVQSAEEKN